MPKHGKRKKGHVAYTIGAFFTVGLFVLAVVSAVVLVTRPSAVIQMLEKKNIFLPVIDFGSVHASVERTPSETTALHEVSDIIPSQEDACELEEQSRRAQKTPLLACCNDVKIRCALSMMDVTGIMFHQASYDYALPLQTELPDADYETVADNRTMRVNHDQKAYENDWADAEVLHLWRTTDATAMDTSIDLGARPGSTIVAPVSGTVVLVRDYLLYDEMPDIEIHIQPEGHSNLDCVLIHTTNPKVKAGDIVQAGLTPIAQVRNIEEYLYDVQLSFFLSEDVGGNHTHIQVNNADYPGYREKRLEGALI